MTSDSPIVIAGGGVGGLTAALALAAIGRASLVLERAPEFREVGAGLQLAPNATRILRDLGVLDLLPASPSLPIISASGAAPMAPIWRRFHSPTSKALWRALFQHSSRRSARGVAGKAFGTTA